MKICQNINIQYFDKIVFKELVKYSFPLIPYTLCWWVINASDRTIIMIFLGTAFNGIYAAAYKFPSLFSMITNIFQLSWNESASENYKDEDKNSFYNEIINKAIRFYSSANIIIIAIMPIAFDFLIKKDFSNAYYYIPILMTAALFHSISSLYSAIYFALKETKRILLSTTIAAIINIIFGVLFISKLQLYATAISSLIAYFVILIMRHLDMQSIIKISINKKYLCIEILVYIITFVLYYLKYVNIIILLILVAYCCYQNKDFIKEFIQYLKKKLLERNYV